MTEPGACHFEPADILRWALARPPSSIPSVEPLDQLTEPAWREALLELLVYARRLAARPEAEAQCAAQRLFGWLRGAVGRRARQRSAHRRSAELGWARFRGSDTPAMNEGPALPAPDAVLLRQLAASRGLLGVSRDLR